MENLIDQPLKQNRIDSLPRLNVELMENMFNLYKEKNTGKYFYNLLQTIVFPTNLPANFFSAYNISYEDTWPLISYKNYKTPNLWWIILHANNILNPIEPLVVGKQILIPNMELVNTILAEIGNQS